MTPFEKQVREILGLVWINGGDHDEPQGLSVNEALQSIEVVRGTENQNLRSLIRELGEALCTSSHEDNDNNCPNNFPHQGDCSACEGRIKRGEAYAKIPKELRP